LHHGGDPLAPFLVGEPDDRAVLHGRVSQQEMIWRVISRYASFAGCEVALSPGAAYAILDGLFQQALLHHLAGNPDAAEDLRANVGASWTRWKSA
jgi:hypothetical protein